MLVLLGVIKEEYAVFHGGDHGLWLPLFFLREMYVVE